MRTQEADTFGRIIRESLKAGGLSGSFHTPKSFCFFMKDYYAVLQVEPSADQAVIDAAYRRLMLKYHPDVMPQELRSKPEILQHVQDINEAYEVLGDPQARANYDLSRKPKLKEDINNHKPSASLEQLFYLVKCSKTHRTFKMTLQRRGGDTGPYKVTALERIYEPPSATSGESEDVFDKLGTLFGQAPKPKPVPPPSTSKELAALFEQSQSLSMSEIDWGGFKCPDCKGEVRNANGTYANWSRCGNCFRLACVGNLHKRRDGNYLTCPWCGDDSKVTGSIATGAKESVPVGGRVGSKG